MSAAPRQLTELSSRKHGTIDRIVAGCKKAGNPVMVMEVVFDVPVAAMGNDRVALAPSGLMYHVTVGVTTVVKPVKVPTNVPDLGVGVFTPVGH